MTDYSRRPSADLLLGALAKIGKPAPADGVLERLLLDHWAIPESIEWTAGHVKYGLRALVVDGRVERVGFTRAAPGAKLAGRAVPVYALTPPGRSWQERALVLAAHRVGGDLADDLLRIRDALREKGMLA